MPTLIELLQPILQAAQANPGPYQQALQSAGLAMPTGAQVQSVLGGALPTGVGSDVARQYYDVLSQVSPGGGGGAAAPAAPPAWMPDLQAQIQQGLDDPTRRNFLLRAFQEAGLPAPTVEQARQFLSGELQVPNAEAYWNAIQNTLPAPTDNPFVPASGETGDIFATLQQLLEQQQGDRGQWQSFMDRLGGLQTTEQMLQSPEYRQIQGYLTTLAEDQIVRDAEQVLGYIPGVSRPPTLRTLVDNGIMTLAEARAQGDLDAPLRTNSGALAESFGQRGGIRALPGVYAGLAGETLAGMNRERERAGQAAGLQAFQMLQTGQQGLSQAWAQAAQLAAQSPSSMDQVMQMLALALQRDQQQAQLAAMQAMGGGGGGGGGGEVATAGTPLQFPNPYAGLSTSGGGGMGAAGVIGAIGAAALPALIQVGGNWITGSGGGGGGGNNPYVPTGTSWDTTMPTPINVTLGGGDQPGYSWYTPGGGDWTSGLSLGG